jgi:hypothetical protein
MSPWRAYLLLLQDFARWTGTYGGMISSDLHGAEIPQMDVVTPPGGKRNQRLAPGRKKDVAPGDTLTDLDPGGSFLSTWTLTLERPMMSSF